MAAKKAPPRHRPYPAPTEAKSQGQQIVPVTKNHKVSVRQVRTKQLDELRQDRLAELETELLETCMDNLKHSVEYASIPFDSDDKENNAALLELQELHGEERGARIFRTIKAAQMPLKDAPAGLMVTQKIAASIIKARSAEKAKPNPLNIAIQVVTSAPQFEEMDID